MPKFELYNNPVLFLSIAKKKKNFPKPSLSPMSFSHSSKFCLISLVHLCVITEHEQ